MFLQIYGRSRIVKIYLPIYLLIDDSLPGLCYDWKGFNSNEWKARAKTPMVEEAETGEYYEFRVKDHLEEGWFRMFSRLSVKNVENGEVLISGRLANQAAVHEILKRIQNLNLVLISMSKLDPID